MQAILKQITNVALRKDNGDIHHVSPIQGTMFLKALAQDPIACGHAVVHACCTSGQQHEQLLQIINEGNINGTFSPPDEPVEVPDIVLLHDVDTCWDSVYLMICHHHVLCLVCPPFAFFILGKNMLALDVFLAHPRNKEIAHYSLSDAEWEVLQDFEAVLAVRISFPLQNVKSQLMAGRSPSHFSSILAAKRHQFLLTLSLRLNS